MKSSRDILLSVLKTVQKGQLGISSMLDTSMRPGLRKALESQLRELDSIENEVHLIASQRGWDLPEPDPVAQFICDRISRIKLNHGNSDSRIADMMIQTNTRDMIQNLKNLHQYPREDDRICGISQKLIDCETANIRQMQSFL